MGGQVLAECDCGVHAEILIGCGMVAHHMCLFPCLCERCRRVVEVDLLAEQSKCPKCLSRRVIPYDDPALCEKTSAQCVFEWNVEQELGRRLILTDAKYRCPNCGGLSLRFSDTDLCLD